MKNNILFIKTFVDSGTGTSLPEIELFISASCIERGAPDKYKYTFFNVGYDYINDLQFVDLIRKKEIDIVVFSVNLLEKSSFHKLAKIIKTFNKNIIVIVSGQLASISKENILEDNNVDIVVYGEIYITVRDLIFAINDNDTLDKVDGICYRQNNKTVINKSRMFYDNVDDFVILNKIWDIIDIKKYSKSFGWNGINQHDVYIPILASFGCPFKCSYCTNRLLLGEKFRKRSVESVINEIDMLVEKFSINEIHFFDAVFNYDKEWAKAILKKLAEKEKKVSISFPHGLRVDYMDEELIKLFEKAGVYKVTYAIETASPRLQNKINKNLNLEYANKIIDITAKTSIIVCGYFMLGLPSETESDMKETIKYACKSNLDIAAFFKYSDLYSNVNKKYVIDEDFTKFGYFSKNDDLNNMKIDALLLISQLKFYLNRKRLMNLFLKSKNKFIFIKQFIKFVGIIIYNYILYKIIYEKYVKL